MSVALAATWNPRGELPRFERLLPALGSVYNHIALSFPPVADPQIVNVFQREALAGHPGLSFVQNQEWSWGRYVALQLAVATSASHVHYADMDRLLRWVETRPEEWRCTVKAIKACDYLVVGRSAAAYQTHPQALVQTEAISNLVISHLVGRTLDVSAGSKGFSRRAAQFLVDNTRPGRALGTDGEWTVLLQRAGFCIDYVQVDGLDWESADRYQAEAADAQGQRLAALAYDAEPRNWEYRLAVAMEIVQAGIEAAERSDGRYTS